MSWVYDNLIEKIIILTNPIKQKKILIKENQRKKQQKKPITKRYLPFHCYIVQSTEKWN